MVPELGAVVSGYRTDIFPVEEQQAYGRLRHPFRALPVRKPPHQQIVPAPLAQGEDGAPASLADYQVHLPVPEPSSVRLGDQSSERRSRRASLSVALLS